MTLVLDASAAVELVLETSLGSAVGVHISGHHLLAPHHIDLEVVSTVRRMWTTSLVTEREVLVALLEFEELAVHRFALTPLSERVWEMRHTVAVPDAYYVALAEAATSGLITTDGKLARTHGHGAEVELVG